MDQFDVVVIGSGPAGQKAAIAAAKLGKRAAIVERKHMMGGVCINTGTIPSKTLREAVLYLTGLNQRELYGDSYRLKSDITVTDLAARTDHVVSREIDVIQHQLARNSVTMFVGSASFVGPNEITVEDAATADFAGLDIAAFGGLTLLKLRDLLAPVAEGSGAALQQMPPAAEQAWLPGSSAGDDRPRRRPAPGGHGARKPRSNRSPDRKSVV